MRPTPTTSSTHIDPLHPRLRAAGLRILLACAAALTSLPAAAQDLKLSTDSLSLIDSTNLLDGSSLTLDSSTLSLTDSTTLLDSSTRSLDSSTLTLDSATLDGSTLTLDSSTTLRDTDLSLDTSTLQIDDSITSLSTTDLAIAPALTLEGGNLSTAESIGLGRLVAPGNEDANVVIGRLGTAQQAGNTNLTIDFEGDGLINFEIAPGLGVAPKDTAGQITGGDLAGRVVAVATGTADRVLDNVINVDGVTAARTFEISDGTVVLGGGTRGTTAPVEPGPMQTIPPAHAPRDPGSTDPATGKEPGRVDVAEVRTDDNPDGPCSTVRCPPPPPESRPGPRPVDPPELIEIPDFSREITPPTPIAGQEQSMDDLLDVSIVLPMRKPEPPGDQFSNHGNEEIW